ncbi:MAG: hypothetical protein J0H44_15000 [Alphaproteobacteria bacterium]|nr:hypothetical protein [Alphaproteobacteria bacterium]
MDARTVLRRAWNDSVWSKVIAAAITAVLAAGLGTLASSWDALPRHQLLQFVATPVTLPAWSLAAFGLLVAVLAGSSCRGWRRRRRRDHAGCDVRSADDIQPNAVPIVEARLFACPLESPTPTPSPVP